jgi:hypothetical protein
VEEQLDSVAVSAFKKVRDEQRTRLLSQACIALMNDRIWQALVFVACSLHAQYAATILDPLRMCTGYERQRNRPAATD